MSEYATNGAKLICDKGVSPTPFTITSNFTFKIQGQLVGTIADKAPIVNIKPFGVCSVTQKPCIPSPIMWQEPLTSFKLSAGKPLLMTSQIKCALGGSIKFMDSGQLKPSKVKTRPDSPQIVALQQAALLNSALVEECEKKKEEPLQKIRVTDVYWMEDGNEERHYDIFSEQAVDLYVETINFTDGETLKLRIKNSEGKIFKGGQDELRLKGTVNSDGIMVVKNFSAEFEK